MQQFIPRLVSLLTMYGVPQFGFISLGELGLGVVEVGGGKVCRRHVRETGSLILRKKDLLALRERGDLVVGGIVGINLTAYFAGAFKGICKELPDWNGNGFPFAFVDQFLFTSFAELGVERLYLSRVKFDNGTAAYGIMSRSRIGKTPCVSYRAGVHSVCPNPFAECHNLIFGESFASNTDALDSLFKKIGEDSQTGIGPAPLRSHMMSAFRGITCHSEIILPTPEYMQRI
jgi:hypothetical protein